MNPAVLVVASAYDLASDLVCLRLKELGVSFLRLNREQLSDFRITLYPTSPTLHVEYGESSWDITDALRSVWFRQPVYLREPNSDSAIDVQLQRSQWMALVKSLTIFHEASWMNHPRETYQAEIKPYQLRVAKEVGFKIPQTLIGNDVKELAGLSSPFMMKPLDVVYFHDGDESLFAYATPIDTTLLNEEFRKAPIIAQRLLASKTDIRVTVVGNAAYAVKILSKGCPIDGDWRRTPKADLHYEDWTMPADIESACARLMDRLGLRFGGIDLVQSEGDTYFLEINPTGEWAWLSSQARPIDKKIAQWLATGGKS
jgi:glutathione synthase/RimK-type ligase-like ATP-grasp enzyme